MSTTRKATDEKEEEEAQARQATAPAPAPQNLLNCRQSKASKQSPETLTMHGSLTFPEEEEQQEVLVINNKNKNTPRTVGRRTRRRGRGREASI
jgi:hypothetical protein